MQALLLALNPLYLAYYYSTSLSTNSGALPLEVFYPKCGWTMIHYSQRAALECSFPGPSLG